MSVKPGSGRPLGNAQSTIVDLVGGSMQTALPAASVVQGTIALARDELNAFAIRGEDNSGVARWCLGGTLAGWPRYVVSKGDPAAAFSSIQAAIDATPAQAVVLVHPGAYDEDVVLKSGVPLVAFARGTVLIQGQVTVAGSGSFQMSGVSVQGDTNEAAVLLTPAAYQLKLYECELKGDGDCALRASLFDASSQIVVERSVFEKTNAAVNDYTFELPKDAEGSARIDSSRLLGGSNNFCARFGGNVDFVRSFWTGKFLWEAGDDSKTCRVYFCENITVIDAGDVPSFEQDSDSLALLAFNTIETNCQFAIYATSDQVLSMQYNCFPGASDGYTGIAQGTYGMQSIHTDSVQLEGPAYSGGPPLVAVTVRPGVRSVIIDTTGAAGPVPVTLPDEATAIDQHVVRVLNTGPIDIEISPGVGATIVPSAGVITIGTNELLELQYIAIVSTYYRINVI